MDESLLLPLLLILPFQAFIPRFILRPFLTTKLPRRHPTTFKQWPHGGFNLMLATAAVHEAVKKIEVGRPSMLPTTSMGVGALLLLLLLQKVTRPSTKAQLLTLPLWIY